MIKTMKFNPGFQTDEEAIANFIVRRGEFTSALEALTSNTHSPRVLIVAPRGAGKTTLCRRVLAETRGAGILSAEWHAIYLGEESYTVTTPGEFFLECLFHLKDQVKLKLLDDEFTLASAQTSEAALLKSTLTALKSFRSGNSKRLLIIVENFHTILKDQIGDDASLLLDALNDDDFGVLATTVARAPDDDDFISLTDYISIPLRPLNLEECRTLWSAYSGREVRAEKIRPLQILTGGSPRLIHILADFMKTPSLHDLMDNLNLLIDQNTEYFKNQLDALAPVERKVFAALLDLWDPSSAKTVAEAARVNVNTASTMLSRLSDKGSVVKEPGKGRQAIYYASERLFNIYYLMRRRSHPSNRVRALVSFMTEYYDRDELVDTTALLVREACSIEPARRDDYHSAFAAIISKAPEGVRRKILEQTPQEFIQPFRDAQRAQRDDEALDGEAGSASDISKVMETVERAIDQRDFDEAERLLRQLTVDYPSKAEPWIRLALLLRFRVRDKPGSILAAEKARELGPDDPWTHAVLGMLLLREDRTAEGEASLKASIKLDARQVIAVTELARHYESTDQADLAISLFAQANADGDLPDLLLSQYAHLLIENDRGPEGEALLASAVCNSEPLFHSRRIYADYLNNEDRPLEAVDLLRNATAQSDRWESWADFGVFSLTQGDELQPEAKAALEKAVELGSDEPMIFEILADLNSETDNNRTTAVFLAEKVVERAPDDLDAWTTASRIYRDIGAIAEAENTLLQAIDRGFNMARVHLAKLVHDANGDADRAEMLLREAAAASNDNCRPAKELSEFLVHQGEDAAAQIIVSENLEKHPECFCSLVLHGQICTRKRDFEKARTSFEAARKLHPDAIPALTGLAAVVDRDHAQALIADAILSGPDDARPLLTRAQLEIGSLEEQIADSVRALELQPEYTEARLLLATLHSRQGDFDAALEQLSDAINELSEKRELIPAFVAAAMTVATLGKGIEVSSILADSDAGAMLEPLSVALQLSRGEQPLVAKEVLEVATDIANRYASST